MVERIIKWSIHNRVLVCVGIVAIIIGGIWSVKETPVDAIPDLSENQVIVLTEWMGRNPQIIEDQITFPLVSNMQGIAGVKTVRAASMFGMSFVFVIFTDNVDIYWARSRVLEKLNYAQQFLPKGLTPSIGPDGTGIGHVFWYTLTADGFDLAELRAIQDWYIRYALQNVPGVSEIASYGGFQKQYQVSIDPHRLTYYKLSFEDVTNAIAANNRDVGGSIFESNSVAYMIRGLGYIRTEDDLRSIAVGTFNTTRVLLSDLGTIQIGGQSRLGIVEENGDGEVVGGIVVIRYGENAKDVIERIRKRIAEIEPGLPKGVEIKVAYDRSELIDASIATLTDALWQEITIVSIVVILLLFHLRSGLVAIVSILLSVLIGFILMKMFGIASNIMSLGGIALAIGDVVDPGIVMAENAYRALTDAVINKNKVAPS